MSKIELGGQTADWITYFISKIELGDNNKTCFVQIKNLLSYIKLSPTGHSFFLLLFWWLNKYTVCAPNSYEGLQRYKKYILLIVVIINSNYL